MAKKVEGYIKLQIAAGNATPAPPVGPALGQKGVNIMDFCKQFNARTQDQPGIDAASGEPNKKKVATLTYAQVEEIAKTKMPDLNAATLEAATDMIKGTARSMGIVVEG